MSLQGVKEPKRHPKGKGAWYFTAIHACPLCGREDVYRERRWDEKPANPSDRFEYDDRYACQGHFL